MSTQGAASFEQLPSIPLHECSHTDLASPHPADGHWIVFQSFAIKDHAGINIIKHTFLRTCMRTSVG